MTVIVICVVLPLQPNVTYFFALADGVNVYGSPAGEPGSCDRCQKYHHSANCPE